MPSPFPGMNPYLEQADAWQDFHRTFCTACRDALVPQIRPNYLAKLEEHVYIHEPAAAERLFVGQPDVSVTRSAGATGMQASSASTVAPVYARILPAVDVERQSYIEVRDRQSRELVTVIELLSPTNKRIGADREAYVSKRRQLLARPVHFVEIDLLRGGPRMPMEDLPDCDYYAIVSRYEERPKVPVWPLRLRDTLPAIPIPLRAPDRDASLDLQQLLHRVYDAAGYEDYIYGGAPDPPLHPSDVPWARELIPRRGTE